MLVTDWLEHTGEMHPSGDISYEKGTFTHFARGDLCIEYGNFYTGVTGHFQHVHLSHTI